MSVRICLCVLAWLAVRPAFAQPEPALRLVFEGDTGGVSSGGALRTLAAHIFRDAIEAGAEARILASDFGALYDQGRYLLPADAEGRLSDVLAVVDGSTIDRLASVEVIALRDRYSINLVDPLRAMTGEEPKAELEALLAEARSRSGRFADVVEERWRVSLVANQVGQQALLLEGPGAAESRPLEQPRELWEVRFRYDFGLVWGDGEESRLLTVERRIGEGTRRMRWVGEQLEELRGRSLFVSAGNAVEGRSWLEGQRLNLQRPTSWDAFREVGLSFLSPAENELAGGVANLRAEAEAAGVRLLSANLVSEGSEDALLFEASAVVELDGVEVAFVGLTDRDVVDALPPEVMDELDVVSPIPALVAELDRLRTRQEGMPDLVVLLTVTDQASLDVLLDRVTGVDLVIGPGSRVSQRDSATTVRIPPGSAPSEVDISARTPITRITTGSEVVGRVDVFLAGRTMTEARVARRVVEQDWEPLSPFIDRINTVRHEVYTAGERILFPDLNELVADNAELRAVYVRHAAIPPGVTEKQYVDRYPVVFSRGLWLHYLANTVRSWTDADVALVRVLPQPFTLSGPISAVLVDSTVSVLDEVVTYRLKGDVLIDLLETRNTLRRYPDRMLADDPPPAASGVSWEVDEDTEDEVFVVGGREIDSEATYVVALTDQLAAQADYAAVLADYEPTARFTRDLEERELEADSEGAAQALHGLAVTDLTLRAEADPGFGPEYVAALVPALSYQGDALVPEARLHIRQLDLTLQQVSSRGDRGGYQAVRNTRVTQPDSLALDFAAGIDLVFDLVPIILTFTAESAYSQVEIDDERTETADDLVGLIDLQYRLADVTFARAVRPYLTARLDSELTPIEVEDDAGNVTELDRELLVRNSLGVLFDFSEIVPELRLGGFSELDVASESGGSSFGGELVLREVLAIEDTIEQELDLRGLYYIPSDSDGDDDLRFTVGARLAVAVPVLGGLRLLTFIDTFVFQGTEPSNDNVAVSVIFGGGVGFRDLFRWTL